MSKEKPADRLHKHTLLLFEGDYAEMQNLYPEVGAAVAIRTLIRAHINKVNKDASSFKLNTAVELD